MASKSEKTVSIKIPFEAENKIDTVPYCPRPAKALNSLAHEKSHDSKNPFYRQEGLRSLEIALGGIIHEFNNIFSVILSNMELAQMKAPENIGSHIEKTIESVRRGKDLVKRLKYSRVDGSRPMLVNIGQLTKQMAGILSIGNRQIRTRLRTTPGLWNVFGDPSQIQMMVMNLLINIRESFCGRRENGFSEISITVENVILPPESIKIHSVVDEFVRFTLLCDNGKAPEGGAERENRPEAENVRTEFDMARQIIKDLGGWMEEEKGQGTISFRVFLPGQQEENKDEPLDSSLRGGCETILLVEDERNMAEAVKELLESLGYSVLIAFSGREAVEIFRGKSALIDMAILDMVLPDIQGLDVLKQIRNIKPEVKVVFSSGSSDVNSTAGAPGPFDFIPKPYDFEHLAHIIRESFGEDETNVPHIRNHVNRIKSYFVQEKTMPYNERLSDGLSFYRLFGKLAAEPREKFLAVFLDAGRNLIAYDVISQGTTDEAVVYPQEIVRSALLAGASFIALVHNHPSGVLRPSSEDVRLTLNIKTICRLLKIELADHVIISKSGYYSFAQHNML